jgi:phosphatidylglycerophosphatase C
VSPAVAAFDFDGTITRRDTLVPFLAKVGGWHRLGLGLARVVPALVGRNRRDVTKLASVRAALAGRGVEEVEALARDYAAGLPTGYRPDMAARIAEHRAAGHRLVLVTASLELYAKPAAEALGFDDVIAVRLVARNGHYTGGLAGPNVRGAEKARRLLALLGETKPTIWAYGNSSGDRELLAMADHAHMVGRRSSPFAPLTSPPPG